MPSARGRLHAAYKLDPGRAAQGCIRLRRFERLRPPVIDAHDFHFDGQRWRRDQTVQRLVCMAGVRGFEGRCFQPVAHCARVSPRLARTSKTLRFGEYPRSQNWHAAATAAARYNQEPPAFRPVPHGKSRPQSHPGHLREAHPGHGGPDLGRDAALAKLGGSILARLIVVSNRVAVPSRDGGNLAGGLAVAVRSLLKRHEGLRFGWSGTVSRDEDIATKTVQHGGMSYAVTDLAEPARARGPLPFRARRVVTPLREGMNLVAKEYIAAQNPEDPAFSSCRALQARRPSARQRCWPIPTIRRRSRPRSRILSR